MVSLFKKTSDKKITKKTSKEVSVKENVKKDVILGPRTAEKSALLSDKNIYTFIVSKSTTKKEIEKAFIEKYKKTPEKINVLNLPSKKVLRRGRIGWKNGLKKAVIFLKKGEKIEFM